MKEPNKWKVYEARKREIKKLELTPEQYHKMIQELMDELDL